MAAEAGAAATAENKEKQGWTFGKFVKVGAISAGSALLACYLWNRFHGCDMSGSGGTGLFGKKGHGQRMDKVIVNVADANKLDNTLNTEAGVRGGLRVISSRGSSNTHGTIIRNPVGSATRQVQRMSVHIYDTLDHHLTGPERGTRRMAKVNVIAPPPLARFAPIQYVTRGKQREMHALANFAINRQRNINRMRAAVSSRAGGAHLRIGGRGGVRGRTRAHITVDEAMGKNTLTRPPGAAPADLQAPLISLPILPGAISDIMGTPTSSVEDGAGPIGPVPTTPIDDSEVSIPSTGVDQTQPVPATVEVAADDELTLPMPFASGVQLLSGVLPMSVPLIAGMSILSQNRQYALVQGRTGNLFLWHVLPTPGERELEWVSKNYSRKILAEEAKLSDRNQDGLDDGPTTALTYASVVSRDGHLRTYKGYVAADQSSITSAGVPTFWESDNVFEKREGEELQFILQVTDDGDVRVVQTTPDGTVMAVLWSIQDDMDLKPATH